ncbi:MAG: cytochrome c3 family protein [Planctomycetota bacterium]
MSSSSPVPRLSHRVCGAALLLVSSLLWTACSGDDGAPGRDGQDLTPGLKRTDPLPGFNLTILKVEGGSGPNGNFRAGDRIKVTFKAQEGQQGSTTAGTAIASSKWSFQEALFGGPATGFQQILSTSAIAANSVQNADGSWTFTWPDPIPAAVPNQINQANTIPYDSGTLAGQPLPDGTYRIGLAMRQDIDIEGTSFRDATSTTIDVLFGNASAMNAPELVSDANCQNCHTVLRAHGENRYGVKYCVLCHTNGSEDLNNPNARAGETLGLSISFQTMIHKVHSGAHLPSVNGKTVDVNGNPVYGAGTPYVIVRSRGEFDFSHVAFPQWPHLSQGMPRDVGYDALSSGEKSVENAILAGPTNCAACHGDPDGSGPLTGPVNGDSIFSNAIVTRACIACHDDWDPTKPYASNGQVMPAGLGDNTCTDCHGENPTNPGAAVNVRKAHTHPLLDTNSPPLWGAGAGAKNLQFNITAVTEAGGDADGLIEVGEKIQVTMAVVDGGGNAVAPADITRMEVIVNGPISNRNLLYMQSFTTNPPVTALLSGAGPSHTFLLPEKVEREIATANSATVYAVARTPIYTTGFGTFGTLQVWTVPTGGGATSTVATATTPYQNYIDVASGAGFAANDVIVLDEGNASAEYVAVRAVQGNRLWLVAPLDTVGIALSKAHAAGTAVVKVTPALEAPANYTVDGSLGTITFASAPSDRVLVTYVTDFVVPAMYRGAINNSPSLDPDAPMLDATIGEWTGKALVNGTYQIGIYGEDPFTVNVVAGSSTQSTSYTEGAQGDTIKSFRLGSTGDLDEYELISAAANCYSCHRDLQFHGAHRRGFANCLMCHGTSGAEDWPQFKTSGLSSPETPGVSIEFRQMIHKIHHGRLLAEGDEYVVAGFNGSSHTYEEVGFPSFKGETANCDACHGAGNEAWFAPTLRAHPSDPSLTPQLVWRFACGSCHDGRSAQAHIRTNSANGLEACEVCHGDGKEQSVEVVHKNFVR